MELGFIYASDKQRYLCLERLKNATALASGERHMKVRAKSPSLKRHDFGKSFRFTKTIIALQSLLKP